MDTDRNMKQVVYASAPANCIGWQGVEIALRYHDLSRAIRFFPKQQEAATLSARYAWCGTQIVVTTPLRGNRCPTPARSKVVAGETGVKLNAGTVWQGNVTEHQHGRQYATG